MLTSKLSKGKIYNTVINEIFKQYYTPETNNFEFTRAELEAVGVRLGLIQKNLGDIIYSF